MEAEHGKETRELSFQQTKFGVPLDSLMDMDSGYESVQSDDDRFGSRHLLNKSLLNPRSTKYAVKRTKVEKITQGEQVVRLSEG